MISKYSKFNLLKSVSAAGVVATSFCVTASLAENAVLNQGTEEGLDNKKEDVPSDSGLAIEKISTKELIEQLSHESFTKRQKSTEELWRRGKPVLGELKKALTSRNPEVFLRASKLVHYIKIGVSPNTPQHITELVQSFDTADKDAQDNILRELYAEKEYSLMLFMLSEMDDQRLASDLHNNFKRLGHLAAQESIINGAIDTAIEQLKLAPRTLTNLRSLAFLYEQAGLTDEELTRLKKSPPKEQDTTLIQAMYLAKKDRLLVRKYAEKEKLTGVLASLDLLKGNSSAMIDILTEETPFIAKLGVDVLKSQYDGENDQLYKDFHKTQLKTLRLFEGDTPTNLTNQVFKNMALTGAAKLLEPYMVENYKVDAFSYFSFHEQPNRALQAVGITGDESLSKFITEKTDAALSSYLNDKNIDPFGEIKNADIPAEQLLLLTEFYYDRGMVEQAKKVIAPLLVELEKLKQQEWHKLIESIAHYGMYDLAIDFIIEKSKDDQGLLDTMVSRLYDDTIDTELVWSTLHQRNGVTKKQSFFDIAIIMGVYQEEIEPYLQLQNELLKVAKRKGVDSLKDMREALFSIATFRQDAISQVKFSKQLLDSEKGAKNQDLIKARKGEYLRALVNTVDSKTLVAFLDENLSIIERSPRWYAIYSIAKRKLGDEDAANKLLDHAKLLSLGLYDDLRDIAVEHHVAGYYEHSAKIMEQILVTASVDINSRAYKTALRFLSASDNAYIQNKQWDRASAFFMINAMQEMISDANTGVATTARHVNTFYNLNFSRGMELYKKGEKAKGLKMLSAAHSVMVGNGTLADHFYPAVRSIGLDKQYDLWVEESHQHIALSLDAFPECGNTHNTLAWLLSRAVRKLDDALKHSQKSHDLTPYEAAYIDTMAEVWHARSDRKKAVEWGEKAVTASMYGRIGNVSSVKSRTYSLNSQLERFRSEPHPKP